VHGAKQVAVRVLFLLLGSESNAKYAAGEDFWLKGAIGMCGVFIGF
jgi:hypothetical protein